MQKAVLIARQLSKQFHEGRSLFSSIDLTLHEKESIAIMGKSGEGKTTLLNILGTLDSPTSGSLTIKGEIVEQKKCAKIRSRHIGFVFQQSHLIEELSLLDNVLLPAKIAREEKKNRERALMLIQELGLSGKEKSLAKTLSGGEKQRAALARALINDPDILLADEPSGSLDKENGEKIISLLLSCTKKWNKSVMIVTHDLDLALRCDRKLKLQEGSLCAF